ncbi:MAG: DUF6328 family protein [Candidatus Nitrotoga sp.]|nr:DUF6328 family protein [Candidatus Nitrotoga sp.]
MSEENFTDSDLDEMLNELRVLLPGSQLLTAFLIMLPFNSGFNQIIQIDKWIFMATFIFSVTSLILFTAPAVQHRLMRPLRNRLKFKQFASRQMIAGAIALSFALVLGADLVMSVVFGHLIGNTITIFVAFIICILWWLLPVIWKKRRFI